VRVVIAEDKRPAQGGLVLLLTSAGHECGRPRQRARVLPALLEHRPDVAVLDVRMPPGFRDEGLRAALEARERIPAASTRPVAVRRGVVRRRAVGRRRERGRLSLKDSDGRVDEFLDALDVWRQAARHSTPRW